MIVNSVAVYCGSALGKNPAFLQAATELGELLAREKIQLVYGGSKNGVMGTIADAVLNGGGKVIGVTLKMFEQYEVAHTALPQLEVAENMHIRKNRMAELSDAFIILPGGAGTLDEFFEQWTWMHIGVHTKPCAILNTAGYYDKLLDFLQNSVVANGYLLQAYLDALIVAATPAELLAKLRAYEPLPGRKELLEKLEAGKRS
jgi:uncharacterized protein (TIGR00730 family)